MIRKVWFLLLFFVGFFANGQNNSSDFRSKKIMVIKDTIKFDTIPINPQNFRVLNRQKKILYPTEYTIIYNKALLIIDAATYKLNTGNIDIMSTDTITTTTVKINKTKIISKTIEGIACIRFSFFLDSSNKETLLKNLFKTKFSFLLTFTSLIMPNV